MTRPLRFLHVTTFYPPDSFGGDAVYVQRLAHALADRGHHVEIVHCQDAYRLLSPAGPDGGASSHPGVVRHTLRGSPRWLSPLVSHQTGRLGLKRRRLERVLAEARPDVIHYHNISLFGPDVLTVTSPLGPPPIKLYTIHEHWLVCPTHVLWKFNRRPCERPQCLRCTLHAARPPQLWRATGLIDRATSHVDRFLAPSRFTIRMHAERGFTRPLHHFPSFTDRVDRDWQEPGPRPHERPYYLFVGRLEPIKGIDDLLAAWRAVEHADLLVVGTGGEEGRLRALAVDNPRIRFLGHRSGRALASLYVHCLALVVPSRGFEVFPLVVPEAFARRAPVIARDLGGLTEMIAETGGGLLFRDGSELRAALRRVGESPPLRKTLGDRGYEAFVRDWTTEVHLDRYLSLVDSEARAHAS